MSGFPGYKPPTSNTTWVINQLFEVVMPNSTEGCWRLVAYMSRKHFGWCDEHGNPIEGVFEFEIKKLAKILSVSERTVNNAIVEALDKKFIRCVRQGQKKTVGSTGCRGAYTLNFDSSGKYAKTIQEFDGFYTGDGHRTAIPDQFFDATVFEESFPVVKVIGAIFRYTIGFQAEKGYRRQLVQMSLRRIQELTGIGGRRHLLTAIKTAIDKAYIKVVSGTSAKESPTPQASAYQIVWSDAWDGSRTAKRSAENPPAAEEEDLRKKGTSDGSAQKGNQDQCKKGTSIDEKREPEDQRKKGTSSVNTNFRNRKLKGQQQQLQLEDSNKVLEGDPAVVEFLVSVGYLVHDAKVIARETALEDAKYCWEQANREGIKNPHAYARSLIEKGVKMPSATPVDKAEERRRLKSEHEKAFAARYEEWTVEEAEKIRETENELYRTFCEKQEEEAFRQARRKAGDTSYDERCPVGSMSSFRDYLRKELGRLPDFWEWDRRYNPTPYSKAA